MDNTPGQLVWLVTGTSSGFGRHLVDILLARGDLVLATVRKPADAPIAPPEHRAALHVLTLDVTDAEVKVKAAVNAAAAVWGRIDVLVNNAGYAYASLLEEAPLAECQREYAANTFGVLTVTNAVLPHMRARRAGTLVFVGSRMVFQAAHLPSFGHYISSKAALHALGETYAGELRALGIRVCVVAPGSFRTAATANWIFDDERAIEDYDGPRGVRDAIMVGAESATGDPRKAMEVLVDAVRGEGRAKGKKLPMLLPMGSVTYDKVREYCKRLMDTMDEWEEVAKDLDFD